MGRHRLGEIVELVRQGIAIEVGFGTHSLEALLWVAESVEGSVYVPESLHATPTGVGFSLANPPLRVGAFGSVAATVDGEAIPPDGVRIRARDGQPWRRGSELSPEAPFVLGPGDPTQVQLDLPSARVGPRAVIRLELRSVAIPPLVWVEVADQVRTAPA